MRIEVGKYYRNREGDVTGPMEECAGGEYVFIGKCRGYDRTFTCVGDYDTILGKSGRDLIEEVPAPDEIATPPPVPTLEQAVEQIQSGDPLEWDKRPGNQFEDAEHRDRVIGDLVGTALAASVTPGYEPLAITLQDALDQAQAGKGKARHNGRGVAFDRQPIMEIGRMVGLGYPTGQAQKKTQEAVAMAARGEKDRAVAELLGAINYLAAAILLVRETGEN